MYSNGGGSEVAQTGSDFGIADEGNEVLEINGLVETNIDISMLPAAVSGVHQGLIPGSYSLKFSYLNRRGKIRQKICRDNGLNLEHASDGGACKSTGIRTLVRRWIVQLQGEVLIR
jgi:hypothetical protein